MKHRISSIEALEARIAPAAILTLTDVDGDIVTITTNKGTNAQLDAAVGRAAAGSVGGVQIKTINLDSNAIFDGTNLSIVARRGPLGGDGLVNVERIDAVNEPDEDFDTGLNLGTVFVDGNLGDFDAGKGAPNSLVKSLRVHSTSGNAVWDVRADIGLLAVKTDLRGVEVVLSSKFEIDALLVGGSIVGESAISSGSVSASEIGLVKIRRDLQGGAGAYSGSIYAERVGSIIMGGSVSAGGHSDSGQIEVGVLGQVTIHGNLSGTLDVVKSIARLTIGGDIAPGPEGLGGSILSGSESSQEGRLGPVVVRGSLVGGRVIASGYIQVYGSGTSISIGGDVVGGAAFTTGCITATGKLGKVSIGGSVLGGAGPISGFVGAKDGIGTVTIGGDLRGGTGFYSGTLAASEAVMFDTNGALGTVIIKGSVVGLSADHPARIVAEGADSTGLMPKVAIGSLTVGGRVEHAQILAGHGLGSPIDGDAQIGAVRVAGDWIASNLIAGIDDGSDNRFATPDDVAIGNSNNAALLSRIASITIGGQVRGTPGAGDHFGFVAQEIGSFSVAGTKFPLTLGRSNDSVGIVNSKFEVGSTGDVSIREVA